jgi:hypothetical protein
MTHSVTRIALVAISGFALSGCGFPDLRMPLAPRAVQVPAPAVQPAAPVAARAASLPDEIEEEPERRWTGGHVPTGRTHTVTSGSIRAPSGGDEDGGWG